MDLQEWTKIFIRQRDALKKEITSIDESEGGFTVIRKDGAKAFAAVQERLEKEVLSRKPYLISCLNTRENVEALAENWRLFAADERLLIVFANTHTNERWLLKPFHHDRIADGESLRQGLLAMHEAITVA